MKILTIAEDLSLTGGPKTFVHEIAKSLVQKGHCIHLIEGTGKSRFKKEEIIDGVKIYRYFVHNFSIFELNPSMCYQTVKIANQLLKKTKFDIIHLHLYSAPFAIFFSNIGQGIPKILHFYGALYLETLSQIGKPKKHKVLGTIKRFLLFGHKIILQRLIQSYCLKKADKIIALSRYCKDLIIDRFGIDPKKIIIATGGINPKIFYPLSPKERLIKREKLGFNKNVNILLIASRIEPRKGIDRAIKALPQVLKKHPDTILLIASPSKSVADYQYLNAHYDLVSNLKLGGKVFFTTGLSKEKLASFYQIADCFLMVSRDLETFGLTTVEALACGTPVLGTPCAAMPEILNPINKNLVLKGNAPQNIASGINSLFSLPLNEKKLLSKKCSSYAKNKFSWGKINFLEKIT